MLGALLEHLAEQRIAQAMARGEFDDLPGSGQPLVLDDDRLVPAEKRVALRVLRNAGCVPRELADLAELRALQEQVLTADPDAEERRRALARLQWLRLRMEAAGLQHCAAIAPYAERLRQRLAGTRRREPGCP